VIAWGVTALSHDAALAVVHDGRLVFAAHAERYSRTKNDAMLCDELVEDALQWGRPDVVVWYERPFVKKLRQVVAGQFGDVIERRTVPRAYLRSVLKRVGVPVRHVDLEYCEHHRSHALAGTSTAPFTAGAVLVADAIGEFTTMSIWAFESSPFRLERLRQWRYPDSLGLLYSAVTRRCGYRPNEEEYIIMGLAAYGRPVHKERLIEDFLVSADHDWSLRRNVHRGIGSWLPEATDADLAASVQHVTDSIMTACARYAVTQSGTGNLVLSGGVALNCVANSRIAELPEVSNIHIFPNPGDAGSSVGAAASVLSSPLEWPDGPYLGKGIDGEYPVDDLLGELLDGGIAGVASGRAEFGPRALGNRSILADPRCADMKDRVNKYKGREPFRPFAPVVRQEDLANYFCLPVQSSPYMQFTAMAKEPDVIPAVCHVDGTSRVQTVSAVQHPALYELLTRWEQQTGCGVLLNTSMNGRGEPLVNSAGDADRFAARSGLPVYKND